jgi:DNA-binding MarR family transcriptional regulator
MLVLGRTFYREREDGGRMRAAGVRRDEEVADLLREVSRELREHLARQGEAQGFARFSRRLPIIREVLHDPGITVNELARRTHMVKSQVSMLVTALESEGLVGKRPDPHDQRLVRLFPTDEGTARAERWRTAYRAMLAKTVRTLSDDESEHLLDGLRALQRALGDLAVEPEGVSR